MKKVIKTTIAALAFLTTSAMFIACGESSLKDSRDGKKYKTVKIGEQVWMAENINYAAESSICYDNAPASCEKYGRLYNWETAKKVCPSGWHLPMNEEWDKLYRYADGTIGIESPYYSKTAGKYLKAKNGWNDYEGKSGNGEDKFGFAALPGGNGYSDGSFLNVGNEGYWWSAEEYVAYGAYNHYMSDNNEGAYWDDYSKLTLFSVRCVQD